MEQHPVPQHIASFEFKLFGNLTVRQFVTLVIPLSVAALIFFSNITTIVRLPLSLVVGIFAFFIALVPIGGRPFDKWIVAFIKAVLSPTQRVWIKEKRLPEFLNVVVTPPPAEQKIPKEVTIQGRERLLAYLRSLPKESVTPLDVKEQIAIQRLDLPPVTGEGLAKTGSLGALPPPIIWPTSSWQGGFRASQSFPQLNAELPEQQMEVLPEVPENVLQIAQIQQPRVAAHAKPYVLHGVEKRLSGKIQKQKEYVELIKTPAINLASDTNYSIENIIPIQTPNRKIKLVHGVGKTRVRKLHFAPPEGFDLSKLPIRGERRFDISDELKRRFHFEESVPAVVLPVTPKKAPPKPEAKQVVQEPKSLPKEQRLVPKSKPRSRQTKLDYEPKETTKGFSQFSITNQKKIGDVGLPVSSAQIIPLTNIPNVVSGVITDSGGAPIEGAVLVIRDQNGIPLRALKTNKLGQFLSATPLSDGPYSIEIESENAKFSPISFNLNGNVVPPFEIKSIGGK